MQSILLVAGARRAGTASVAAALASAVGLPARETGPGLALLARLNTAKAELAAQLEDASALAEPCSAAWLERTLPAPGAVWRVADPFPDAAALAALRGLLPELPAARVVALNRDIAGFIGSRRRVQPGATMLDHCTAWARCATELDRMEARHPRQLRNFHLSDLRRDPAAMAESMGDFVGLEGGQTARLAQALATEIRGRRGMLDGGSPPTLGQLALTTPEMLLIEQICGPIMQQRGEALDKLQHLRRISIPLLEVLRLRPFEDGGLALATASAAGRVQLCCEAAAAASGRATMDVRAFSLAGRSSFAGRALLGAGAPAEALLRIMLTESLSGRPVLAGQWTVRPGQEAPLAARFGATDELLDMSLSLAMAPGVSTGTISLDVDGLFSIEA
jgi:hypothetical protein